MEEEEEYNIYPTSGLNQKIHRDTHIEMKLLEIIYTTS